LRSDAGALDSAGTAVAFLLPVRRSDTRVVEPGDSSAPPSASLLDSSLLSLLRCVECGHARLVLSADQIVCAACTTSYDVRPPGIPRLITHEQRQRNAVHEQQWDNMPLADYEQICRENGPVWEAIDAVAMKYCSGSVLEVCCGHGRFLDVLTRNRRVERVVGLDISVAMLRAAWDKGHRLLIQGSADDSPLQSGILDAVASSGSGLSFLDRERTYVEIARVLKPEGFFVFDLLNFWPSVIDEAWRRYISKGRLPRRDVLCDYKLADNMRDAKREVHLLRRAGFAVVEMKSVRYVPFLRRRQTRLGYWPGFWGSKIGYDTVFICQKVR
jgi:SAM-dependent methyltransferase